jgi:uncharacterized membrane protein
MVGMLGVLVYTILVFARGKASVSAGRRKPWLDFALPILALIGLGVSCYLSYVETQLVSAICGSVGDCNAVQGSPYAKLFGVLPVGVLGATGYVAILGAWLCGKLCSKLPAGYVSLAIFGMALFGVLFSLYLTFLEPFVIKAVCIWCLSSAVIITLLLLLSLAPALQAFSPLDEDI